MKLALRIFGWLIAVTIAAYFVWFAFRTFSIQDLKYLTTLPVIAAIIFGACLYALIMPITGAAWAMLLRCQGEAWSTTELTAILAVTQLAKYVPGGVMQPIGRAALSLRNGMKLRSFTASVVQETVLTVSASVTVGACLLLLSRFGFQQIPAAYRNLVLAWAFAGLASVVLLASSSRLLASKASNLHWMSRMMRAIGPLPNARATLLSFFSYCLNYLLIGMGIWVIGQSLGLGESGTYALLTAAFALAWLLGFVVPGAPAGLGVREGVLTLLLASVVEQSHILALVIAIRLMSVIGDGLCFGAGLWGLRRMSQTERG